MDVWHGMEKSVIAVQLTNGLYDFKHVCWPKGNILSTNCVNNLFKLHQYCFCFRNMTSVINFTVQVVSIFEEFLSLLDEFATRSEPVIVAGDFNIRRDQRDSCDSRCLIDVFDSYGLRWCVSSQTHDRGGILDVVATRTDLDTPDVDVLDVDISDYRLLCWSCQLERPPPVLPYVDIDILPLPSVKMYSKNAPKTYQTKTKTTPRLREVVMTGGIDFNPLRNLNRFLEHQWANVGSSHRCRYQRCPILYLRRFLCRRLRPVSARVRSLVVESYLGCGSC